MASFRLSFLIHVIKTQKVSRECESTYRCYFCPSKENQKTKIRFMFFSVLQESNIRNSLESRIRAGIIPILQRPGQCYIKDVETSVSQAQMEDLENTSYVLGTQEKLGNHTSLQFMLSPQFSTCSMHFIPKQSLLSTLSEQNLPSVQQSLLLCPIKIRV